MALFKNQEQQCLDTLKKLHETRGKLELAITQKSGELATLKAGVSEEGALSAFEAGESFTTGGTIMEATVTRQLADFRGAHAALIRKIKGALLDLGKARGAAILKQAKPLRDELTTHREKTAELLRALEAHTRCKFVVDELAGADVAYDKAGVASVFRNGSRPMPRRLELEREIETLEAQARKIEAHAQRACEGGHVSGETLAELLAVVEKPELLTPSRGEIESWYAEVSGQAEAQWKAAAVEYAGTDSRGVRYSPPDHTVRFTLVWTEGTIDHARSRATNQPVSGQSALWNCAAAHPSVSVPSDGKELPTARQW